MQKKDDERVLIDEDFIHAKRFDNSVDIFLDKNENGADFPAIASFLQMPLASVVQTYEVACRKLRRMLQSREE